MRLLHRAAKLIDQAETSEARTSASGNFVEPSRVRLIVTVFNEGAIMGEMADRNELVRIQHGAAPSSAILANASKALS